MEARKERFVVVVFNGVPLGVVTFGFGVFEVGQFYNALPGIEVRVVAGEPETVLAGGGLTCTAPYDLDAIRDADVIIVPKWRSPREIPPEPALQAIRAAHANGARVAGMCSGAFVLAAAGLLDGRPATTHWAMADQLGRMYPEVRMHPDQLYIDDGDVLTAGGGAAGMDLSLHLIRSHCGAAVANRIARNMVVAPHRAGGQAQYIEAPVPDIDQADPVGETMTWALGQLGQTMPVELLARHAGMSRRNFDRRFREITGTAPASWLTHQRVLRAQQLLEATRLPVEEVARRCGFGTGAALRPHFRRVTGTTPAAYRTTFAMS
ncbi:MAG TPA: helix-turn-helix domain-containing protein [Streptosporangiaceae bacterium]|nr:helix-turn-helix domain-containing protein [Streptosporangiaceae bacterium]